ncbi:hypothetical protein FB45DRAFT_1086317 [Roridomyces roridus]|uniref:F-box domain-containing protein n=1 Tax=Roridomyces roridus TaxID=1738132 RepID=A0AAD7BLN1_9AGAR|nr:hypothetical protein FB45DRAFT_1086317 [Roridomyces roridus]
MGRTWASPCNPLLIASVCRQWREIALALKPIWSKFEVSTDSAAPSPVGTFFEYWLPRAGTHPLEVSLFYADHSAVLTLLQPYLAQLETLECVAEDRIGFPNELLQGKIPNLRSLRLTCEKEITELITTFVDCPQLRELCLFSLPSAGMVGLAMPWDRLTRLDLIEMSLEESLSILRQTPALQTLAANGRNPTQEFSRATTFMCLPQLHTLNLNHFHRSLHVLEYCQPRLLAHLTLPALTHIEFPLDPRPQSSYIIGITDPGLLATFVARSKCTLRSITLYTPSCGEAVGCLQAAGWTVTDVNLRNVSRNTGNLGYLLDHMRDTVVFVPNLTSLSINPCLGAIEIPFGWLASVLAMRRDKLKRFELVIAGQRTDSIVRRPSLVQKEDGGLDALWALKRDGVRIDIRGLHNITETVDPLAVYPPMPPPHDD